MSIILDFHLGHAGSPRLVVFWVFLQLIIQIVPKKETKRENKRNFFVDCVYLSPLLCNNNACPGEMKIVSLR